jgi:tetratricopeptide (TPR) repeat protein
MGDTDEAVALINKAIELEPRDAKYYAGKANILWEMQERDQECLAAAQQACALDPGNGTHHQMCAQVLMRMGRLSEALAAIDQALKRHDRDPNLIILKASVLKAQGDLAGAEEAATTAITRMPSASSYRLERAQIRFARKNFAGAIEDTNLPLEKRNWHNMWEARSAWMLRARSYAMMQDKAHASATFLRAIQVCPSDRKLLVEAQAYFKSIADAANEQSIAKRIKDIDTDLTPPKMPI